MINDTLSGFAVDAKNILIGEYEQHRKVNFDKNESIDGFLFFHNAFRHIGIEMKMVMQLDALEIHAASGTRK